MVKRIIYLVLMLLLTAPLNLLAAQVTAVADRDRISSGESLQLQLRVQGSPDGDPDLSVLDKDWEVVSRSKSSQMQIINGSFSRSQVYSLTLMPRRSGQLQVPAVCFGADCSMPLPIEVGSPAPSTQGDNEPLQLEAEASPRQTLVGAQVILTVRVLHRIDLVQASLSDPKPEGVENEIQQLGKDRTYETHRNGYLYQVFERRYVIFAHQAGTLHLPALQLDAQVTAPPSHFDPFGQMLRPLRRFSQPLDVKIDAPPADPSNRTWLPARQLTLEDDWQQHPPLLRVGEPATRTLVLQASGLPAGHLPELKLPVPDGWKSYPDQPSRKNDADADGILGTLTQKIALVPTRPGEAELPAVDLDWYDLTAGQWRRAHLAPLRVTVAPAAGGTTAPAPPPAPTAAKKQTPHSAPTPVPAAPPAASAPPPGAAGLWPWLSLVLGVGLLACLLLLWRSRRPSPPRPAKEPLVNPAPGSEKDALKAVLSAANGDNPGATRQALLAWSRYRWPEAGRLDLEGVAARCGEPLAGELVRLGQALYAKGENSWRGDELSALLQRWLQQQKHRPQPDPLPPLYPEKTGKNPSVNGR